MAVDYDKLNFYTGANYMKRSDKSGSGKIPCAGAYQGGPAYTVPHNLGYVPQSLIFAELDNDGFLWYGGQRVWEKTGSTLGDTTGEPPSVELWVTENNLILYPKRYAGERTVHWVIYSDYSRS